MSNLVVRIPPPTIFSFQLELSARCVTLTAPQLGIPNQSRSSGADTRLSSLCLIDTILPPLIFKDPAITIKACCGRNDDGTCIIQRPNQRLQTLSCRDVEWWLADKIVRSSQQTLCRNDQRAPQGYENSRSPGTAIFVNGKVEDWHMTSSAVCGSWNLSLPSPSLTANRSAKE